MDCKGTGQAGIRIVSRLTGLAFVGALIVYGAQLGSAQGPPAAEGPKGPVKLEVADGTKASYRAKEQLAGVDFQNDAIGTTNVVKGTLVLAPDGSVDSGQSKLTVDLRTLTSDQDMRDGYVKSRTLETDKYPFAEFVPRRVTGLPSPLPGPDRATAQSGFKLTGDLTIHGTTKEVTFNGYATLSKDQVSGHATTDFTFMDFGLAKPKLARILSVDDKIQLELDFKMKRS